MYPDDLKYTAEHEWVRVSGEGDEAVLRLGITSYAQDALGDIVYVTLPTVGADVEAGQAFGEVESTKSVSDIYSPVSGVVTAANDALDTSPELLNQDPYGDGWIVEVRPSDGVEAALTSDKLLDAAGYEALVSGS